MSHNTQPAENSETVLLCHISARRSLWAENGRQWWSRPDPTQRLSGEQEKNNLWHMLVLKWNILCFFMCMHVQVDIDTGGPALCLFTEKRAWRYCRFSLRFLPPGHYQEEGKGCSFAPCHGTWIPHFGTPGHPALWWVWRGSELYRSPLKLCKYRHFWCTKCPIPVPNCTNNHVFCIKASVILWPELLPEVLWNYIHFRRGNKSHFVQQKDILSGLINQNNWHWRST